MRIYTRTGDDGSTGLLGGGRVAKNSHRMEAIGDVDELNAALGVAIAHGVGSLAEELGQLQRWLFDLGAELAAPEPVVRPASKDPLPSVGDRHTQWLEAAIDRHMEALPPLKAFILPGGSSGAAAIHFARTVCRRAERAILALHTEEPVGEHARVFVNRLSDYLFAAARAANAEKGVPDVEWHPQKEEPC